MWSFLPSQSCGVVVLPGQNRTQPRSRPLDPITPPTCQPRVRLLLKDPVRHSVLAADPQQTNHGAKLPIESLDEPRESLPPNLLPTDAWPAQLC